MIHATTSRFPRPIYPVIVFAHNRSTFDHCNRSHYYFEQYETVVDYDPVQPALLDDHNRISGSHQHNPHSHQNGLDFGTAQHIV